MPLKYKKILSAYTDAYYKTRYLADDVFNQGMERDIKLGEIPILPRQHNFTSEYFLRTDGLSGWALYDKYQPQAPIIQFDMASREIFPADGVQYNHKQEKIERSNRLLKESAFKGVTLFNKSMCQTASEYNNKLLKSKSFYRTPVKNYFETIYTPENDDELDDELQRIEQLKQTVIDGQFLSHLERQAATIRNFYVQEQNAKFQLGSLLEEKCKLSSKWVDDYYTMLTANIQESSILSDIGKTLTSKLACLTELVKKVKIVDNDKDINIVVNTTSPERTLLNIYQLPTKIKEFNNREPNMWFGFKKNNSLHNLLIISGFSTDILEITDTRGIHTVEDYAKIYTCLRKVCAMLKTRQFISFCNCYNPPPIVQGVSDKRLAETFCNFAPGILMNIEERFSLLSDITSMCGARFKRFLCKTIHNANIWFKDFEDVSYQNNYFRCDI